MVEGELKQETGNLEGNRMRLGECIVHLGEDVHLSVRLREAKGVGGSLAHEQEFNGALPVAGLLAVPRNHLCASAAKRHRHSTIRFQFKEPFAARYFGGNLPLSVAILYHLIYSIHDGDWTASSILMHPEHSGTFLFRGRFMTWIVFFKYFRDSVP